MEQADISKTAKIHQHHVSFSRQCPSLAVECALVRTGKPVRSPQVTRWVSLRSGIGHYYCLRGLHNPLDHPLLTKFYKGLRKRANKESPRPLRRTEQISRALLTKLCHANLSVSGSARSMLIGVHALSYAFLFRVTVG